MIWIISMDKERHVQRQAFPSGQALRDFANGAPYSWYEQKVLLVTEDRLVLYSSMERQKGTKKMQMQDVLAWYLDALGEGRADATYARLTGAREIQEGDFCLAEDAADWSPSPDGAGECWVYQLTPGCHVDEVLGTYVETWENEDTASVYFFVEPGYDAAASVLQVEIARGDGSVLSCERMLNEREYALLLRMVQAFEVRRLQRLMRAEGGGAV